MVTERYVVVGLAHVRSTWFTEVARWSTAGSLPLEFHKCISSEELRTRVASGRPFSAALLDSRLPTVDRDLLAALADRRIPTLVVTGTGAERDWASLGATDTIAAPFDRASLLNTLVERATMIGVVDDEAPHLDDDQAPAVGWRGRLVAVTGAGGAGTSTVAVGLAQGLGRDARFARDVILADLAHHAHQALLHDAGDIQPGIQELVEAHRAGRPTLDQVRQLTYDVPTRGYRLLLGLRRPRDWVAIRAQTLRAAMDGLRRTARLVVADVDRDLEGEPETGSFDIEDRNLMTRSTIAEADVVVVVGQATTTGLHALVAQLSDLRRFEVPGERLLVVVNRAPRSARPRAEITRALADLTGSHERPDPHGGPIFVPERRGVDALHRDLARLPGALADPPAKAAAEILDRVPLRDLAAPVAAPIPITPGSLGQWDDDDLEDEAG